VNRIGIACERYLAFTLWFDLTSELLTLFTSY